VRYELQSHVMRNFYDYAMKLFTSKLSS